VKIYAFAIYLLKIKPVKSKLINESKLGISSHRSIALENEKEVEK